MRPITCLLLLLAASIAVGADALPKVRSERPRIFLRRDAWGGPSIGKIRSWLKRPEYKQRMAKLENRLALKSGRKNMKLAILWILRGDRKAGKQLLDRYMTQRTSGHSPSYWGIVDQRMAACYDWLGDHPDFTDEMKANRRAYLEMRCRGNIDYLKNQKENPFYSRFAGALAGLTACALAIHGEHPAAEDHLRFAYHCFREKMSRIRRAEDGATGGSSYGYHHEFTDLANLVACWRSATDWDAARWIKQTQGNWLERQMLYQIWMTHPNGRFVKDGDGWGRGTADRSQYRMSIDAITGMYRNGYGRAAADAIYKRWGLADYHQEMMWMWFVFNDPTVEAKPLSGLGRAEVFSRDLIGMVCWRDGWGADSARIYFRCGEGADTHCTQDQGKFILFKERPLAHKDGDYIGWMTPVHRYYKSPWSANCVLFTGKSGAKGDPSARFPAFKYSGSNPSWPRGLFGWAEWKALREKSTHWVAGKPPYATLKPMGRLIAHEANDRYARAVCELDHVTRKQDGSEQWHWRWTREMVYLGYKYLIVRDRVKVPADLEHRWTLHTIHEPKVEGNLLVADNGPARLFCRTLLPERATLTKVGGAGHEMDFAGTNALPKGWTSETFKKLSPHSHMGAWRLDVRPADGASECTYVHVLFPTTTQTAKMPPCSVAGVTDTGTAVTVGKLSYTFPILP